MQTTAARPASSDNSGPAATRGESRPEGRLELDSVAHSFGTTEVLAGIDLGLRGAELVAVVGPSGCGKSTLLELIAGLAEPTAGTITVDGGSSAAERLAHCAYMPQRDMLLPWLCAIDNAALALRLGGASRADAREQARPIFQRLGLEGFEQARASELSGGMRQRVAFARTLLTGKPLLLLDEPFAALDAITRADLQQWLLAVLEAEPRTVALVTHDVEEALFVADRVIVLSSRPARAIWEGSAPRGAAEDRADAITDPAFIAAREQALHALEPPGAN